MSIRLTMAVLGFSVVYLSALASTWDQDAEAQNAHCYSNVRAPIKRSVLDNISAPNVFDDGTLWRVNVPVYARMTITKLPRRARFCTFRYALKVSVSYRGHAFHIPAELLFSASVERGDEEDTEDEAFRSVMGTNQQDLGGGNWQFDAGSRWYPIPAKILDDFAKVAAQYDSNLQTYVNETVRVQEIMFNSGTVDH